MNYDNIFILGDDYEIKDHIKMEIAKNLCNSTNRQKINKIKENLKKEDISFKLMPWNLIPNNKKIKEINKDLNKYFNIPESPTIRELILETYERCENQKVTLNLLYQNALIKSYKQDSDLNFLIASLSIHFKEIKNLKYAS